VTGTDSIVERILTSYGTITVVGASRAPHKAAHSVPAHMQRHGWRIIPVNPHADQLLGEPAYRTLADVPEPVAALPLAADDAAVQAPTAAIASISIKAPLGRPAA